MKGGRVGGVGGLVGGVDGTCIAELDFHLRLTLEAIAELYPKSRTYALSHR